MCGRFNQAYTWRELVALCGLTQPALNLQPRYNIAPTATMSSEVLQTGRGGSDG
jgi:putative SOS response-associated peptidase YedK